MDEVVFQTEEKRDGEESWGRGGVHTTQHPVAFSSVACSRVLNVSGMGTSWWIHCWEAGVLKHWPPSDIGSSTWASMVTPTPDAPEWLLLWLLQLVLGWPVPGCSKWAERRFVGLAQCYPGNLSPASGEPLEKQREFLLHFS